MSRLSDQLIEVAKARIEQRTIRSEANLRRATSDLYYALFHAICEALVEHLGGDPHSEAYRKTFTRLYRQVRHDHAEKRCNAVATGQDFPSDLRRFAKQFVTLKTKRELADYDPLQQFSISVVRNDLQSAETRLGAFWTAEPGQRATFACHVGLKVA